MNILLYLQDRIVKFKLPSEVSGSFSFDAQDSDNKLINVEAIDGSWCLYSTDDSKIVGSNNSYVEKSKLISNNFYILEKESIKYLIYTEEKSFKNMMSFTYDYTNPLVIGNTDDSNIKYMCPYVPNLNISISKKNDSLYLKKDKNIIYKNERVIKDPEVIITNGDEIELCGIRLLFVKNNIYINNVGNRLAIGQNIKTYDFPVLDKIEKRDIKDQPLYKKEDYYSKSPRIRRQIEEKHIKLDKPPHQNSNQELPLLLTIGPMITMGATSGLTLLNLTMQLTSGAVTFGKCWPQLFTSVAMISSMFIWPALMKSYNKKQREENEYQTNLKYAKYFDLKKEELGEESKQQSIILFENLITVDDCLKNIKSKSIGFWDKRLDQYDFLVARLGLGRERLRAKIDYPDEGFTIDENEMKKRADELINNFKYIYSVPVGYSFKYQKLTAIMGNRDITVNFVNNIILQLISFHSHDDLKLVLITNKTNMKDFEYIKYLNHSFNNSKTYRYFASSFDEAKNVNDVLSTEIMMRNMEEGRKTPYKPHYLIIVDDYEMIKQYDLINMISESEKDLGVSVIFLENKLSNLPSKCDNFITLGDKKSDILYNAFDSHYQGMFNNEIHYGIDMMDVMRQITNIPVEFDDKMSQLPESISFMEMEHVGKVEQLNILNRWRSNDPTRSLRAEIGVDSQNNVMYLDLHEKYHGPHGLIAGMTGSGKSEFIITYILSMALNFSPEEVSFILIDYKGGGLAGAFENKITNIVLPHLAGTITNLDKAEMDRTLVSIDSELKRRQRLFNEARDKLGESTIDIYKYQRFYRDGRIEEPIPHLFIICDEFAELKAQQPDFMDSLISTARIGRSLGVHLILATQKPSGVVNEQIWSNTKFRVCLKVQDASDSKEMLKKPDAAELKQAGRFYLQVGYDEYYALGQSAWCGAKYFPAEKVVKQVDKSINFIDDSGDVIKSIQESSGNKVSAQGEQISAILKYIIEISKQINVKSRRLWLENIPEMIFVDALKQKYNYKANGYEVVLGEYDAPELQVQGIVSYNYINNGNTAIYGLDGAERELFLNTLIYNTANEFKASDINFYIVDYGSESLRMYQGLPHIGGMVFLDEEDKFNNLIKMIREEIQKRKGLFANYGGSYDSYIKSTGNKLPIITIILNNYDSIHDNITNIYEVMPELTRDSDRYGIVFMLTANSYNSISNRVVQNMNTIYAFHLKEKTDYNTIFNKKINNVPRDAFGRGMCLINGDIHEFQTANIIDDTSKLSEFAQEFIKKQKSINEVSAKNIPVLPEIIRYSDVNNKEVTMNRVPIGIAKNDLSIVYLDLTQNIGNVVVSNRINNTKNFTLSLLQELREIKNSILMVFDPMNELELNNDYPNYYTTDISSKLDMIINYVKKLINEKSSIVGTILVYGFDRFIEKIDDKTKLEELTNTLKQYEKISIISIDDIAKIKDYSTEKWFNTTFSNKDAVWIGKGISNQSYIRIASLTKEMLKDYDNDMGFVVSESYGTLCKFIDFISNDDIKKEEEL